jgi:hypothetical protein
MATHPEQVNGTICTDAMQPGGKSGSVIESSYLLPRFQKSLLHNVLGVGFVSGYAIRNPEDRFGMAFHKNAKCVAIAAPCSADGDFVARLHPVDRLD